MKPSEKVKDYDISVPLRPASSAPFPYSIIPPYPSSYFRAITNKFTPQKLSCSLQKGPPIFLIGPAMIPNVLKYILSAHRFLDIAQDMTPATLHAHTLYCVRPPSRTAVLDTPYLIPLQSPSTTVTGLAIFNLTDAQRMWLHHFETTPFKQLLPVHITICLSNNEFETIDAGAFVEIIKAREVPPTTTSCFDLPSASTSINWLLATDMQQYRCDTWDITPFLASALYKWVTGGFAVRDMDCGDGYWQGKSEGETDKYEYDSGYGYEYAGDEEGEGSVVVVAEEEVDSEWEREEVEEVDADEIEIEGGVEGEGGGWGKGIGMGVGVGMGMGMCRKEGTM